MIDTVQPLTAKAKLAMSRAELLAAMGYETVKSETDDMQDVAALPRSRGNSTASALGAKLSDSVLGRWWHRHPLSSVVQLGEPLLESYAQKHPGRLIAYGAGTGALLWFLKPWKLLSAATVVTLILKNSDLPGIIADAVGRGRSPTEPADFPPLPGSERRQPGA